MLDYTAFASFARSAPPFNLSLDSGREAYYQLGFIFRQTTTALAPILTLTVVPHDVRPQYPPWLSPPGDCGDQHNCSTGSAYDFAAQDDFALEPGPPCDGR